MYVARFRAKSVLIPTVVLAVFLTACGGAGGGVAATVNGVDISVSEVQAMRISEEPTINKAAFAEDLTNAIINTAIVTAARDEFSIEPTSDEVDGKKEDLASEFEAAQGITVEDYFATQGLPIERFDDFAKIQVIRDHLSDQLAQDAVAATDADAQLLLSANPTVTCLRHILVPTEQEAIEAMNRIEGGEEFASVAAELGTDGTAASGGDLGCQPLNNYVVEFADAAAAADVGVVSDPVESQFGWHLILVDPILERLKEQIDETRVSQLVEAWLLETATDATVEVDEQYGVWVTEPNPMVQAPSS